MAAGHVIVAVVAAMVMIGGGAWALLHDQRDEIAEALALPMYLSSFSQAIHDLRKKPHWIVVGATTIWAPLVLMTAMWLAEAARQGPLESREALAKQLDAAGLMCAIGGYLMATLPMGTLLGTVAHIVFAAIFAIGGTWLVTASTFAFEDDLTPYRQVLDTAIFVGWVLFGVTVPFGMYGTCRLNSHKGAAKEDKMQGYQVRNARKMQAALAFAQIFVGTTVGLGIMFGGLALADFKSIDHGKGLFKGHGVLLAGMASFAVMLILDVMFYAGRDLAFAWCQSHPAGGVTRESPVDKEAARRECWKWLAGGCPSIAKSSPPDQPKDEKFSSPA
jgi:hypothetical protein